MPGNAGPGPVLAGNSVEFEFEFEFDGIERPTKENWHSESIGLMEFTAIRWNSEQSDKSLVGRVEFTVLFIYDATPVRTRTQANSQPEASCPR